MGTVLLFVYGRLMLRFVRGHAVCLHLLYGSDEDGEEQEKSIGSIRITKGKI